MSNWHYYSIAITETGIQKDIFIPINRTDTCPKQITYCNQINFTIFTLIFKHYIQYTYFTHLQMLSRQHVRTQPDRSCELSCSPRSWHCWLRVHQEFPSSARILHHPRPYNSHHNGMHCIFDPKLLIAKTHAHQWPISKVRIKNFYKFNTSLFCCETKLQRKVKYWLPKNKFKLNLKQSRKVVILLNFGHVFRIETMRSVEFVWELTAEQEAVRYTLHNHPPGYLAHVHSTDQLLIAANTQTHVHSTQCAQITLMTVD